MSSLLALLVHRRIHGVHASAHYPIRSRIDFAERQRRASVWIDALVRGRISVVQMHRTPTMRLLRD